MATAGEAFLKATAENHAVFDACLVNAHREFLNWTTAKVPGNLVVTVGDLHSHVREQLIKTLRGMDDLGKQDFSKRRPLIDHIVFMAVQGSGIESHGQKLPTDGFIQDIATSVQLTKQAGAIPIASKDHPLQGDFGIKYRQTGVLTEEGETQIQNLPFLEIKDQDRRIVDYLWGEGNPALQLQRVKTLLEQGAPYLMTVDDTEIEYRLLGLREKLRTIVGNAIILDNPLREKLLSTVTDDWLEVFDQTDSVGDLFSRINTEVHNEARVRDEQVEENIMEKDPSTILDLCFRRPLHTSTLTPDMAEKLIRRRPVMEYLILEAAKHKNIPLMQIIAKVYEQYFQKLNLPFGQLGHMSLAIATQDARYNGDLLRRSIL